MAGKIIDRVFVVCAVLGALYAVLLGVLTSPALQRHALYAHRLHTAWYHDLNKPENFGFAKHQVSPFSVTTPDNETLYAWHILPLKDYATNEHALLRNPQLPGATTLRKLPLGLLSDPEARLVINFHGNAGHLAQSWRTDTYRSLSTASSKRVHLLAFDYRGFGLSSGSPTEEGLIADGVAMVDWALHTAKVPPEKIILMGQSLGTAVASAVAAHFAATSPKPVEFAGVVLVSGFCDIPTLMKSYRIGGIVPVLSPMRMYPTVQQFFSDLIVDTWNTTSRLTQLAKTSPKLKLSILHARDDFDIGWKHADLLLAATVRGMGAKARPVQGQLDSSRLPRQSIGDPISVFEAGHQQVRLEILNAGGHNRINTYAPVALAVSRIFDGKSLKTE